MEILCRFTNIYLKYNKAFLTQPALNVFLITCLNTKQQKKKIIKVFLCSLKSSVTLNKKKKKKITLNLYKLKEAFQVIVGLIEPFRSGNTNSRAQYSKKTDLCAFFFFF